MINVKRSRFVLVILIFIQFVITNSVHSQDEWQVYSTEYLNISFSLPADWSVDLQQDEVFAVSKENLIGFLLFRPSTGIAIEDYALDIKKRIAFEQFDLFIKNEEIKINNINALASEGSGYAAEFDEQLYFFIITIKDSEKPLVAFTFCVADDLIRNEKTMKEILLSFSKLTLGSQK